MNGYKRLHVSTISISGTMNDGGALNSQKEFAVEVMRTSTKALIAAIYGVLYVPELRGTEAGGLSSVSL